MKKLTIVVIISFDKIPISNLCVYFDFKHFFAVTKVCLDFVNESQPLYAVILERVPLNFDKVLNSIVLSHSGHEFYDFSLRKENKASMSKT